MFDILVIGGGPAGVTAALRARELGAEVALLERGSLGGTCTNDGCVPTRVQAKAARLLRDAEQFGSYGLIGPVPHLDFPKLLTRTREIITRVHEKKQILSHMQDAGIAVFEHAHEACFVDPHAICYSRGDTLRDTLQADKCILCTGGHARKLPFPGSDLTLTPSDVWTLKDLPRSVVVVGAAATGCQLASIMAAFGAEVMLLETAPRLLPGEDASVSEAMTEAFLGHGIRVVTGIGGIERVQKDGTGLRLDYIQDERACTMHADAIMVAVGWPGNVAGLNLSAAGVHTERDYVVVDDALRTSAPHIFAAGDVTGRMMLVQSAYEEARVAAENAVLGTERKNTHRIVPHGGFTDPEYGSVGLTEEKAREKEECLVSVVPYADLDRAVIDRRTAGVCKLIISRDSHQILGAHVVGEQALEVVQIVAAGMAAGMGVDRLAELELAYPTFAGIVGLAARHLCREMGLVCRMPHSSGLEHPRATEWEHNARNTGETSYGNVGG